MAKNRVLIFTNHFFPETFKVNDIAFDLVKKGNEVTVITGIPNYPEGAFFKGYGIFQRVRESIGGVNVIRLPLIPRGKGGGIRLIFNYISYLISLLIYFPFLLGKRYDSIFVHHTSPIFIGIPAVLYKKIRNKKLYFWNLDLWPESVSAAGGINNKFVIGLLDKLVGWIYKNCDYIFISSKSFKQSVLSKLKGKLIPIIYLPNWAEDSYSQRVDYKINECLEEMPYDGFKIMFAGNMGDAQDLNSVLQAIVLLKEQNVKWIFVGDGRRREEFLNNISNNGLQGKVFWLGRHPLESMPSFYAKADAMLVSLKNEKIFELTLPAKVQSYMASGKPILGMISGEGRQTIIDAKCGYSSDAGDILGFVENIKLMMHLSSVELDNMGLNGLEYYKSNFTKDIVLQRLYKELAE